MKWISVIRMKPAEMQDVLVFDDAHGIFVAYYFESSGCFIRSLDGARLTHASYWMPLPAVPV